MKSLKYILMLAVCAIMTACGGGENLEAYKNATYDYLAANSKFSKEEIVGFLDTAIDSMAIDYITVGDSIALMERRLEKAQKKLSKLKADEEYYKRASMSTLIRYMADIANAEDNLKEVQSDVDAFKEKYSSQSPETKLLKVFKCRVNIKSGFLKMFMDDRMFVLFPLNGYDVIDSANSEMISILSAKETQDKKLQQ